MNDIEIKKLIRDGLKRNGMTQAALASQLDIERATVNRWCVGRAIPEADTFMKVCSILQIPLDQHILKTPDSINTQILALLSKLNFKQKLRVINIKIPFWQSLKNR